MAPLGAVLVLHEVVGVAPAAPEVELLAQLGLVVVVPALEGTSAGPHLSLLTAHQAIVCSTAPVRAHTRPLLQQLNTAACCELLLPVHPVEPGPDVQPTAAALAAGRPVAPLGHGAPLGDHLRLRLAAARFALAALLHHCVHVRTLFAAKSVEEPPCPRSEAR